MQAPAQTILPPGSVVQGKTIGEWTRDWWDWWFSFPAAIEPFGDEPLTDITGEHANDGQTGPVFFINGTTGPTVSGPVTRTFTVPGDKYLLLPLLNFVYITSAGETCGAVAPGIETAVDGIDALFLEIDGVVTPEAQLANHRESTGCYTATVSVEGNAGGEPVGAYPGSYGSGYWVMIAPLPAGTHVIRAIGAHSGFGINIDVTDTITPVAPFPIPGLQLWGVLALAAVLFVAGWFALRRRRIELLA
jgi:hypothetical protein